MTKEKLEVVKELEAKVLASEITVKEYFKILFDMEQENRLCLSFHKSIFKQEMIFTHKLYPTEVCLLLPNSKFIEQDIPTSICWMFNNSMIIRDSSCRDAGFYPSQELLKQLGY